MAATKMGLKKPDNPQFQQGRRAWVVEGPCKVWLQYLKGFSSYRVYEQVHVSSDEKQKIQDGRPKNGSISKNVTYVEKCPLKNACMKSEPNRTRNEVRMN